MGLNILYYKIRIYLAFQIFKCYTIIETSSCDYIKGEKIEHYKKLKWSNKKLSTVYPHLVSEFSRTDAQDAKTGKVA